MQLETLSRFTTGGQVSSITISLTRSDLEELLAQLDSNLYSQPKLRKAEGELILTVHAVEDA